MTLMSHFLSLFCPSDSAIVGPDGEVLFLRSSEALDYGTLGAAARSVLKYCPLKVGDIALLNDPSSGGVRLGDLTFVVKLCDIEGKGLWLAHRHRFTTHLISGKTIEEEGVRIPPTPIYQSGQLNEMILTAIQSHPLCPPDFRESVTKSCLFLQTQVAAFQRTLERHKISLRPEKTKAYLERCSRWALEKIQESRSGEARAEILLDDKEMIRLHLNIHDGLISMDFSGTTNSAKRFMTENATYGVCFEAISRFYQLQKHINAGSFSVLQITKPSLCMLNARYPAPMNVGATAIKAALQTLIAGALAQIHNQAPQGLGAFPVVEIEISKSENCSRYLALPGGAGGRREEKENFLFSGNQRFAANFSIEKWEHQLPLRIQRLDYRNSGTGKSSHNGGHGLVLKMEALQDLNLCWRTDLTQHRPKPVRNSVGGDAGEIQLQEDNQEPKTLPPRGSIQWKKGDHIIFSSGNGAGWPLSTKNPETE